MTTMVPRLESARTVLRLAAKSDVPAILDYYRGNRAHLSTFEPLKSKEFYTEEYWKTEVSDRLKLFQADQALKLFLFEKTNPTAVIGSINFSNVVRGVFQACTLGYSVAAEKQGQGYMTEALQVAIHYVFTDLKLHRIMANYIPHNERSGKLLRRLGFGVEGYARDYLYINGQWQDHILTSLINPNW